MQPPPRPQVPLPGAPRVQPGAQQQRADIRARNVQGLRILVWNWNADGIRLCGSLAQPEEDVKREGFFAFVTRRKDCLVPDFFTKLAQHIQAREADIVVFCTQEEQVSGTYFHSEFLQERMPEIGYVLAGRAVLDDVGEVASGRSLGREQEAEGSIRISVYIRRALSSKFTLQQGSIFSPLPRDAMCEGQQTGRVSGMVGLYLSSPTYGNIAFFSLQLPDGKADLRDPRQRAAISSSNQVCLSAMFDRLIFELDPKDKPDYVFLAGDFNSHVYASGDPVQAATRILASPTKEVLREYLKNDELGKIKTREDGPFVGLNIKEGISDSGPLFPPTYPMVRGHPAACAPSKVEEAVTIPASECYAYNATRPVFPSWRDRILYGDIGDKAWNLVCLEYTRVDYGNTMNESSHISILGVFVLTAGAQGS